MRLLLPKLAGFMLVGGMAATCQTTTDHDVARHTVSSLAGAVPSGSPELLERSTRYRLRTGDSFDLDFSLSPEFNQTVVVQPDGYVTLKSAGSMYVEGKTQPQLADSVQAAYAKILHDPIIAIALKDFERPYFIAAGQVQKPGKYDLRSAITVTQAVAIAGGFNEKAKHSQVVLYHPTPTGEFAVKILDIKKLMANRALSEDIQLQPGDTLYVPQNKFSRLRPFLPSPSLGAFINPTAF
jgi:polysaccharide export outer membrane protein